MEPGEGRIACLMALHSFAMGLSTVFFETAASALFVSRFGASALPWVYIAAAVVSTGAGALFSAARARLAFRSLMAAVLLFLLASVVVGLRLGLALGERRGPRLLPPRVLSPAVRAHRPRVLGGGGTASTTCARPSGSSA